MKRIHFLFFFLFFSLSLIGQRKKLHIKISDEFTGAPIPEATINVFYSENNQVFKADSNGSYVIDLNAYFSGDMTGKTVDISIEAKGYKTKVIKDVAILESNFTKKLYFKMQRDSTSISGYVKDKTSGQMLNGVEISYLGKYKVFSQGGFFELSFPSYEIRKRSVQAILSLQKEEYQNLLDTIVVEWEGPCPRPLEFVMEPSGEGRISYNTKNLYNLSWTFENLNEDLPGSWCYNNSFRYCTLYGRLYTWEAAKVACESLGEGWRLPSEREWEALAEYYGGYQKRGAPPVGDLKRAYENFKNDFKLSLGGYKESRKEKFWEIDEEAYYWTSTEDPYDSSYQAMYIKMSRKGKKVYVGAMSKKTGMACRCVKSLK